MIVKAGAGGWTLIRQMDHATHCAGIARAWREGPFGAGSVSASLEYAAGFHDLGWTEIDKHPEVDAEGHPNNFTRIDEARHTEFYSGAVRTIAETDPYAAYLVSLHASGLYSRRYGWTGLKPVDWTAIGLHGRALLQRERQLRTVLLRLVEPVEAEFEAAWRNYMLLETFDYLSLLTCFGFESTACGPVPSMDGQWENLSVRRLGPWEVELDPFPFAGDSLELPVISVHLDAPRFGSADELQAGFARATAQAHPTAYRRRSISAG